MICAGCEYEDDAAGTLPRRFDAHAGGSGEFQHTDVGSVRFADFWVFDVTPDALGSISADFTLLASIGNFAAAAFSGRRQPVRRGNLRHR